MTTKIRLNFSDKIQSEIISYLTREQSHYVKDVMRLKTGDSFSVFNDQGEWNAIIESYEKDGARIKILKKVRNKKSEKNVWLAFSPIKQNPLNFMIQKTTELGIQKFIPVICERSVVNDINIERIKKIIIESSEQSNRLSVPEITKKESLKNFLKLFPKDGCIIFCDINCNKSNFKNILSKKIKGPVCILVGPEGDFSENERQLIIELNQTSPLSLASNILRAETAAIAATTIINFELNSS
ncbi:MAG: RNA methyltransferase [Candidatus Pelagibacter sp.]|jgi:16S rRNA (uracil1498-N3)-methyltransferase|nr:RNA methyltransferase [Candidatus Pelagibacter sp.]MDP6440095.1 RsmE family RNA methyltransferase [Pelagibacteraceae bacterium]|tara:strand:+ start:18058 stop:18780 length:723 start_codon:yes stop_codon:yes gene_type:complete